MTTLSLLRFFGALVLGCALSGSVLAAEAAVEKSAKTASGGGKGNLPVSQYRATSLLELRVKNEQNEELGVISELLIDKEGRVSHVILQAGGLLGMGEHRYAVPWDRVAIAQDRKSASIDVTKEQLDVEFSAFEPEEPRESVP